MPLPTLDDFKRHLDITNTKNDGELGDTLLAARDVAEGVVGPLSNRSITETHLGVTSGTVILRHRPVLSLASVELRGNTGWHPAPQALSDFDLNAEAGLLHLGPYHGDVAVTYTAGFNTVPYAVWLAVMIIGAHLWETQRGTSPTPLTLQQADEPAAVFGAGFAIPNRAKELLAPYARAGQIA